MDQMLQPKDSLAEWIPKRLIYKLSTRDALLPRVIYQQYVFGRLYSMQKVIKNPGVAVHILEL